MKKTQKMEEIQYSIKNSNNAHLFPYEGEINNEPSQTVPDQTMSMREILDRFARGLPIEGNENYYYDEDDDLPDPRTLDLTERADLAQQFKNEIFTIRENQQSTNVDNSVDKPTETKTEETES